MRAFWTLVHRYLGLLTAGFPVCQRRDRRRHFVGSRLDDLLNPHLMEAHTPGTPQPVLALRGSWRRATRRFRCPSCRCAGGRRVDRLRRFAAREPGDAETVRAGFNQIFVDPVSGEELGKREWGAVWPITKETFVSFLYRLHYTLHIQKCGVSTVGVSG
jgi:uncharacterized iron-regulated membrane protein